MSQFLCPEGEATGIDDLGRLSSDSHRFTGAGQNLLSNHSANPNQKRIIARKPHGIKAIGQMVRIELIAPSNFPPADIATAHAAMPLRALERFAMAPSIKRA